VQIAQIFRGDDSLSEDYAEYQELAERVATLAGRLLRGAYGQVVAREKGPGDLVTDADLESQRLIEEELKRAYPEHTLLAEEEGARADPARAWRWIVDPLDGTINFAHGFGFWCVSIGLEHAGELVVGVVHNPLSGDTYSAAKGRGATLNGRPMRVSGCERLGASLIATGFPTDIRESVDLQMAYMREFSIGTHSVRRTGSSALNLAIVAAGGFEVCYATVMNPWDAAAGVVLVREAGGIVSDLAGGPYDVYRPEILATNGRVQDEALRTLAAARQRLENREG
jgi:myo-inositol-1(or 4)-monophosphatase